MEDRRTGERNVNAKLTADTIRKIRADLRAGHRQVDIAARYGIAQSWVSWIKQGKAWRHLREGQDQ